MDVNWKILWALLYPNINLLCPLSTSLPFSHHCSHDRNKNHNLFSNNPCIIGLNFLLKRELFGREWPFCVILWWIKFPPAVCDIFTIRNPQQKNCKYLGRCSAQCGLVCVTYWELTACKYLITVGTKYHVNHRGVSWKECSGCGGGEQQAQDT